MASSGPAGKVALYPGLLGWVWAEGNWEASTKRNLSLGKGNNVPLPIHEVSVYTEGEFQSLGMTRFGSMIQSKV